MEARTASCVRDYISGFYRGGLIGISDIADYCHIVEGELYRVLLELQVSGEIKVIKRYFCPEFHRVDPNGKGTFCGSCNFIYSNDQLEVAIYIQPLKNGVAK